MTSKIRTAQAIQRRHFFINLVIIPIREFVEKRGYSPDVGWLVAQLVSWQLKACLSIPAWLMGHHRFAATVFGFFTAVGIIAACAPWFGFRAESIFVINRRRAEREGQA